MMLVAQTWGPIADARVKWSNKVLNEPPRQIVAELRQVIIDALDLVEQTAEEKAVIAALNALEKEINQWK